MTDEPIKTRVMLWLTEEDAIKLRTLAAAAGCRGVSEYISDFVIAPANIQVSTGVPPPNTKTTGQPPTYVEHREDGMD